MQLRGMITTIRPHKTACVIILKMTILSLQIQDTTTTDAIVGLLVVMMRVTKNAADLILEAVDLQEGVMRDLLAQAKEALVALTTGMQTLRLSPRFMSLLSKGSLEKMILEESLESSVVLKK